MPILIALHNVNGNKFYYNASCIYKVYHSTSLGRSEIINKDGKSFCVMETPDEIDKKIGEWMNRTE